MNSAGKKITKLVGVRLSAETFGALEMEANAFEISPTSRARQIIEIHFGLEDGTTARPSPRRPLPLVVTAEMKRVADVLSTMVGVQKELRGISRLLRNLPESHATEKVDAALSVLPRLQSELSAIKAAVLDVFK